MNRTILIISALLLASVKLAAQEILNGIVYEQAEEKEPLVGVNLYWKNTSKGAITDTTGTFQLPKVKSTDQLVVSYVGYDPVTITVPENQHYLEVTLDETKTLDEISIVFREKSTIINTVDPINSQLMTEKELFKAACCNLSESFETNPSVDVAFTDAVTGTKQIEMLGLAGPYTQITVENMPMVRGLATVEGLTYLPGTWMNSIQVTKGSGSVLNGYESIAGQINVEMRKPDDKERLFANAYVNEGGRSELNLVLNTPLNSEISSGLLLHGAVRPFAMDRNQDTFQDMPTGNNFVGINRWHYHRGGMEAQLGVKGLYFDNQAGQMNDVAEIPANIYKVDMRTKRAEVWGKTGYVFVNKPYQSFGWQWSGTWQDQDYSFGNRVYRGDEQSFYSNLIFQSIIGNTNHVYKLGFSYLYDKYNEHLDEQEYQREESVPGVFAEYTFNASENFNMVAGVRADFHNLIGTQINPRLHTRYAINDNTTLRASVGRGMRIANIFTENFGMLISSRELEIRNSNDGVAYGLAPEIAWNGGLNLTHEFRWNYRDGSFSLDYYHTNFQNQVVVDRDHDINKIIMYNLDGRSFSNSLQAEANYEVLKMLDVRLAYRWYDVQTDYLDGQLTRPLMARHRAFMNIAYEGIRDWNFDYTVQWIGTKRIPGAITGQNYSPDFFLMNAQVTKTWGNFDLYLGMENLLNYRQPNPILGADQPFDEGFDSSIVWGPVFGRMAYLGVRYKLFK